MLLMQTADCFLQALILARCSGAVTVSSLKTLKNLLGSSPEWFEPSPRVAQAHDGGFLGLEVNVQYVNQWLISLKWYTSLVL